MNPDERANEKCTDKIFDFLTNELQIDDARNIKIDRAHRIGRFKRESKRPIVVKFNYHQDKLRVKQTAFVKLKDSDYGVSDQYPNEIRERWKNLSPYRCERQRQTGGTIVR